MPRINFNNKNPRFYKSLQKEVEAYFRLKNLKPTGNIELYFKAFLFISFAFTSYIFLLFGNYNAGIGIVLCIIMGLTLAGIAMNVMHDACHGSFSQRKWINTLTGLTMNALGSNAFLWKIKHNIIHHTYTNIATVDSDIENWPLLRQTPVQKCLRIHRYQHLYMFLLYAVTTLHWMLIFDFEKYFTRRFASTMVRNISLTEHVLFWLSKILYVTFYIAIPITLLGWQAWLIGFLIVHTSMGVVLTTIFQLAHLVEKTTIENGESQKLIDREWAIHELMTTADFATGNKVLNWYLGGLNFQVEHHLFPRISHIHYPALNSIVKRECSRFGISYHCYDTLREAIFSHVRLMKKLGQNNVVSGKL